MVCLPGIRAGCRNDVQSETDEWGNTEPCKIRDTHGSVYSHRLSYLNQKVRKGGDFFYGKSGDENYIEGV